MARWTKKKAAGFFEKTPQQMLKRKVISETANQITANVVRMINMQKNCVAYRINNVGIWDEAKRVHRKANTEKGLPDIIASIQGQFWGIEVKAGKDKQSEYQKHREFEINRSGGFYFVVRSTDEFISIWNDHMNNKMII